jgi:hypothetical protein
VKKLHLLQWPMDRYYCALSCSGVNSLLVIGVRYIYIAGRNGKKSAGQGEKIIR